MDNRISCEFKCYYKDCLKKFQCKANLVRHVNTLHLNESVYSCPLCEKYFTSISKFSKHQKLHKIPIKILNSKKFLLSEHYKDKIDCIYPSNILTLPVLPQIEEERISLPSNTKLRITPEILSALMPQDK